ncbi:MAG TPA: hypothetical protein VGO50_20280 [Pyrinomonadaceae bacterium]|jgi:hypothetical protein|nr:hypothetical protein [Pyrinomonadaceae bacterium]
MADETFKIVYKAADINSLSDLTDACADAEMNMSAQITGLEKVKLDTADGDDAIQATYAMIDDPLTKIKIGKASFFFLSGAQTLAQLKTAHKELNFLFLSDLIIGGDDVQVAAFRPPPDPAKPAVAPAPDVVPETGPDTA